MTAASATSGWATAMFSSVDRADPLAARLDDVLAAVGDLHVAVGIDRRDVAGGEPAVGVARAAAVHRRSSRCRPRARAPADRRSCLPSRGSSRPSSSTIFMSMPDSDAALLAACGAPPSSPASPACAGLGALYVPIGLSLGHAPGMVDLRRRTRPGTHRSAGGQAEPPITVRFSVLKLHVAGSQVVQQAQPDGRHAGATRSRLLVRTARAGWRRPDAGPGSTSLAPTMRAA